MITRVRRNRLGSVLLTGGLTVVLWSGALRAADRVYVMPDGRTVGLTRSATEFGVTLKPGEDEVKAARRMKSVGDGELLAHPDAPVARVRLLRVEKADTQTRGKLRQDPSIADVRPVYRFASSESPVISTGEVVLKVKSSLSIARIQQLWTEHEVKDARPVDGMPGVFTVGPFDAEFDEVELAAKLALDRRVEWSQPNFRRAEELRQVTPTDPLYGSQWHLHNIGQFGGTPDADIDAPEAWAQSEGQDILIGMFDDSCDVEHEDLRENYSGEGNDVSLPSNNSDYDNPRPKIIGDSHGTQVMGLATGRGNNFGGRGVAHLARFTVSRGLGELLTDAERASAYTFARQQDVDVHINSWGLPPGQPNPQILIDAFRLAFNEGRNLGDQDDDGTDDPLGMVIVFAAGNSGEQNVPGFELSTEPEVIAVGSSTNRDLRSDFSNFGSTLDILAPGEILLTTDNTDGSFVDPGANANGFNEFAGLPDIPGGRYTGLFAGTSGSCPIVAGTAALILSTNPLLTATDVRLIIEHTADPIAPQEANYHGITRRSLRYGYGRVNAGGGGDKVGAVEAAQQSLNNGRRTWPDRPANVVVQNSTIRWNQGFGTNEFLVLESNSSFSFVPEDGRCYDNEQLGCDSANLQSLPAGVSVLATGCNLTCTSADAPACTTAAGQCVSFLQPGGTKFFAIYGRSSIGRYSWGVAADSTGAVTDSGQLPGGAGGGGGGGGGGVPQQGPAVTISVSPLRGKSPLTVNFAGNATSQLALDESKTAWDFDVDDDVSVDARSRNSSHTYSVGQGIIRTFVARFTMVDIENRSGFAEVAITVEGEAVQGGGDNGDGELNIIVGLPGTPGSNVDTGTAPFSVLLSVDASGLTGMLQSVSWDLGDGARASTLTVPHTYLNTNEQPLRIPITATVTMLSTSGTSLTTTTTRFITVNPGQAPPDTGTPQLPGTGAEGPGGPAVPCGAVGMIPLLFCFLSLAFLRRRCG